MCNPVMPDKAAFLVKRHSQRTVPRSDLQYPELSRIPFCNEIYQHSAVSHPVKCGINGNIFDFEDSPVLVRHNAFRLHTAVLQHKHAAAVKVAVNHGFLLIRQQKQREILLFVLRDFFDSHCSVFP